MFNPLYFPQILEAMLYVQSSILSPETGGHAVCSILYTPAETGGHGECLILYTSAETGGYVVCIILYSPLRPEAMLNV
jgi:hypothetical protein